MWGGKDMGEKTKKGKNSNQCKSPLYDAESDCQCHGNEEIWKIFEEQKIFRKNKRGVLHIHDL